MGKQTLAPIAFSKGALSCGCEVSADLPTLSGDLLTLAGASLPILAATLRAFALSGKLLRGWRHLAILNLVVASAAKARSFALTSLLATCLTTNGPNKSWGTPCCNLA